MNINCFVLFRAVPAVPERVCYYLSLRLHELLFMVWPLMRKYNVFFRLLVLISVYMMIYHAFIDL